MIPGVRLLTGFHMSCDFISHPFVNNPWSYERENLHRNTLSTSFNLNEIIVTYLDSNSSCRGLKSKKWPEFVCHSLLSIVNLLNKIYFFAKFLLKIVTFCVLSD